ncbi:MAG TPA: T9SS type A sorting domain-containing protein [Gammaproteobacteria bacterium]|nr:T9SS type A sorting domain-containing protein [Gammaproteobacteria bacterium]
MLRLLFFILIPAVLFAQSSNWNSVVDLNLSVNSTDRLDLYTDKSGNHILVENGSTLKYYLYSYSGSLIRQYTIDASASVDYSKIVGWDGTLYVSYKKGSTIYTKVSNNAGQSWSGINNISMNNSNSDGLELWADDNGLHIVYSEWDSEQEVYETKYKLSQHRQSNWINQKTVTDESNIDGGRPSVTTSSNRVHVSFTSEHDYAKTRDKYNTTWQTSQTQSTYYPLRNTIIATSTKLHSFYSEYHGLPEYFYYKNRDLTGSTWSSASLITASTSFSEQGKPDVAVSANDKLHLVYGDVNSLKYREWDGSMSSDYTVMNFVTAPRISANSNDVYVIGITDDGNYGYEIKMRQRDYAPLAPQSLSVTANQDDHPLLQWNANDEADLRRYRVYRLNADPSVFYTTGTSFVDKDVEVSQSGTTINYEVKAEDWGGNISDASNQASINGYVGKRYVRNSESSDKPDTYSLYQNYPNPFNPSTVIRYDLPSDTFVSIDVYDINGKKILNLVSAYQNAGSYEVNFDGTGLSSGIYIYKITSGKYTSFKRMLLLK